MRTFASGALFFAAIVASQILACAVMLACATILQAIAPEFAAGNWWPWLPVGGAGVAAAVGTLKVLLR